MSISKWRCRLGWTTWSTTSTTTYTSTTTKSTTCKRSARRWSLQRRTDEFVPIIISIRQFQYKMHDISVKRYKLFLF
jgi:hypothetical protein